MLSFSGKLLVPLTHIHTHSKEHLMLLNASLGQWKDTPNEGLIIWLLLQAAHLPIKTKETWQEQNGGDPCPG